MAGTIFYRGTRQDSSSECSDGESGLSSEKEERIGWRRRRRNTFYESGKHRDEEQEDSGGANALGWILAVVLLIAAAGGGYYLWRTTNRTSTNKTSSTVSTTATVSTTLVQTISPSNNLAASSGSSAPTTPPPTSTSLTSLANSDSNSPSSTLSSNSSTTSPASSSASGKASSITTTDGVVNLTLSGSSDSVGIALLGATVNSYIHDGVNRIYTDGGVPICWPIYESPPTGNDVFKNLAFHGLARTLTWDLDSDSSVEDDSGASAVFTVSSSAATEAIFDVPFNLTFTVLLSTSSLSMSLLVASPSSSTTTLSFQAVFHYYLLLPSDVTPPDASVSPLNGLTWMDSTTNHTETNNSVAYTAAGGVYAKYFSTPDEITLNFSSGGGGTLKKTKMPDLAMWDSNSTDGFVALEPGTLSYVSLKAGENWTGSAVWTFD